LKVSKYIESLKAPLKNFELLACIAKMEGIKAACVVGIPDMIVGDLACAVVVKDQRSSLTEQDIIDEIARNFPLFKRLHGGAYLVDELPLTPSGKIKKRLVRKQAAQMYRSQEINGNY
jgi:acyl-CoA synthetase (AMP-forming)/AMP-acid ligase II